MNTNRIYSCLDFSIKSLEDEDSIIFDEGTNFIIPTPGIYTLEGPNRSGKSVLIRYIMSALPASIVHDNKATVNIISHDGPVKIKNVSEALNYGLVAVFQDDELIPTMTIKEQLFLRHYKVPKPKNWFMNLLHSLLHFAISIFFHYLIIIPLSTIFKKADRINAIKERIAFPEIALEKGINALFNEFNIDLKYLHYYPRQISGGTRDTIRVINALLTENIKILFLDEAISHVAENNKDDIIDKLKIWRDKNNSTIVVITHDSDERLRWQPNERIIIDTKNKILTSLSYSGYTALEGGIIVKEELFPIFETVESSKQFIGSCTPPFVALIDSNVAQSKFGKQFLDILPKGTYQLPFSSEENNKSLSNYSKTILKVIDIIPKSSGTLIVIGGGITLNFGAFIAATIHRGLVGHVLVPTNTMAVADVAVGSKASLNIANNRVGIIYKNIIGAYVNPKAVIMDVQFFKSTTSLQKKMGLAECLKHGLLQKESLYYDTINLIKMSNPDDDVCFNIACKTQKIKSSTLLNDPFELKYGRILLYGHLHAHSIERINKIEISHGLAVYWGILLELRLSGNSDLYEKVFNTIFSAGDLAKEFTTIVKMINSGKKIFYTNLYNRYISDNKTQHSSTSEQFNVIELNTIGQYSNIGEEIIIKKVNWSTIKTNIEGIVYDIESLK